MACRLNGFPPRCSFILRRVGQVSSFSGDGVGSQKKKLKKVIFGIALIENDGSIIKNAGGYITDWKNDSAEKGGNIIATSNKKLHKKILKILQNLKELKK